MLTSLVQTVGIWFVVACALEFAAVFTEQAGAVRSPEEEGERRHGFVALLALTASLLTPGLLLAHGFLTTRTLEQSAQVTAIGLPIAAMLGGALVGALFGAMARGAAGLMRLAALPLALAALAVAIYATLPSIRLLLEAGQNGWTLPAA